ncbi:MAG: hypothetical protein HZA83_02255, partial [Thaumarchaeota archaeon]|nr:hypothetical protein [Nitrososphaerota archaeon]
MNAKKNVVGLSVLAFLGLGRCGEEAIDVPKLPGVGEDAGAEASTGDGASVDGVSADGVSADTLVSGDVGPCTPCAKDVKKVVLLSQDGKTEIPTTVEGGSVELRLQEGGDKYTFTATFDGTIGQVVLESTSAVNYVDPNGNEHNGHARIVVSSEADAILKPSVLIVKTSDSDFSDTIDVKQVALGEVDTKAGSTTHVYIMKTGADKVSAEAILTEGESLKAYGAVVTVESITSNGAFLSITMGDVTVRAFVSETNSVVDEGFGAVFGVVSATNTDKTGCTSKAYTLNYGGEYRDVKVSDIQVFGESVYQVVSAVLDENNSQNTSVAVQKLVDGKPSGKVLLITQGVESKVDGGKEVGVVIDGKPLNVIGSVSTPLVEGCDVVKAMKANFKEFAARDAQKARDALKTSRATGANRPGA